MKQFKILLLTILALVLFSCKKDNTGGQIISIPNGNFEQWDNMSNLLIWHTNSCPACVPPFETYIVQKVTDAESGQFAAKFIYNNVYSSFVNNKFPISLHPLVMTGYIKSNITNGDTASIHVDLFSENSIVDSGNWYETSTSTTYRKFEIPISQNNQAVDSAEIVIVGGKKQSTEITIDNLQFLKR